MHPCPRRAGALTNITIIFLAFVIILRYSTTTSRSLGARRDRIPVPLRCLPLRISRLLYRYLNHTRPESDGLRVRPGSAAAQTDYPGTQQANPRTALLLVGQNVLPGWNRATETADVGALCWPPFGRLPAAFGTEQAARRVSRFEISWTLFLGDVTGDLCDGWR